jgi:hypothetical protein
MAPQSGDKKTHSTHKALPKDWMMVADLPDSEYAYQKVPFNLSPTNDYQPDLILYKESATQSEIIIVELTVPLTSNVEKRHAEKTKKYENWALSFPAKIKSTVIAFEVAADTGFVSKSINDLYSLIQIPKKKRSEITLDLSVEAVRGSSKIHRCRNNRTFLLTD